MNWIEFGPINETKYIIFHILYVFDGYVYYYTSLLVKFRA